MCLGGLVVRRLCVQPEIWVLNTSLDTSFLFVNETVPNIQKSFKKKYRDDAVDHSTASRWASRLFGDSGDASIRDFVRSGWSHTAQTPNKMQRIIILIFVDKV